MRWVTMKWVVSVAALAGLVSGLGADPARAGTLSSASLQILIAGFPPAVFSSSGLTGMGSATGTGATAAWSVGVGAVPGGSTTATIAASVAPPISQIQFIINGNPGAGNFVASNTGAMAVTGQANVKAYGGMTLLGVPVTVGVPTLIEPPVVSGIGVTAFGNAWTTKTTSIALATTGATVLTVMGANGLAGGVGTVVLVTALNVLTNAVGQVPAFAILTLNYVPSLPEPGTLLLLATGAAGLLRLGRRKQRMRS